MTAINKLPPKDVTIIGAGIVGICCAISLLKRGISVRVLEKDGIAEATSSGNAGVISHGHVSLNPCLEFGKKFLDYFWVLIVL